MINKVRVARRKKLRQLNPKVRIQVLRTPLLELCEKAPKMISLKGGIIRARSEHNQAQDVELLDEQEALYLHIESLGLSAKQAGYHLTNFSAEEVERRCNALLCACRAIHRFEIPGEWVKGEWISHTGPEWEDESHEQLQPLWESFWPIRNSLFEIAVAVRPELWKSWPYRGNSSMQTASVAADELVNPNDPRDTFIYDSMRNGKALKWIQGEIEKRNDWEQLVSLQSVSAAAKRFAERKELLWPLRQRFSAERR